MAKENNNRTKRVKTVDLKKNAKSSKKGKKVKFKEKHPKASKAIKIGLLVFVLLLIIGAGVLVGAFYGIIGDELKISRESLVVGYENSTVYDKDGNLIATLSGGTKRKSISLSEMTEYLPKAYVAIEDERFYEHSGIDIWRTAYATVTYILNGGKSSFGGSTITQQVIKNITQEKDNTALAGVMRKVKEISKAIQVEQYLSKDQILELYLNLIFTAGNDINGVELGAIYYFNKSAKDLSIAECAYMAGINHSPNAYKPFKDYSAEEDGETKKQEMTNKIKNRTKTVLAKMLELAYITEEQYNEAVTEVDNGLHFENGESASATTDVSYHTAAAIEQILDQMMEKEEDLSRDMAEMKLYSSGYKIYTTQDTAIQAILEEEISSDKYFTERTEKFKNNKTGEMESLRQTSIPTMVIEDHTTGQIVACATAQGEKGERTTTTKLGYLNYPTALKKQTGSSMKPISVIAPGLITGTITGATTYIDSQTTFGSGANAYTPKNYDNYSNTIMNMRTAIKLSKNVPHVKALENIGIENAKEFCASVGIPEEEIGGLSAALGGLTNGVSPTHMAAAYSAIANDGVYISPTFYTKVTDSEGNTVYEPEQTETRVMSEQLAYIEKSILTEPVYASGGTAPYCALPGIQTAAKTGTTNGDYDRWLCGFSPYYTASCWYGYSSNAVVKFGNGNPAGRIWAAVMKAVHEELPNKQFDEPEGILRATVCTISGKLANANCGANVYSEVFTADNIPTEECEGHSATSICLDSGLLATPNCPNQTSAYIPEKERNANWVTQNVISTIPTESCTLHAGGGASYVTAEDQIKFQAATDAAAMGLMGVDADAYIQSKLDEWRRSQGMQTQQTQPQHTHSYTITSQTEATCTKAGTVTKTCSCGDVKTETLPAKGHTFNGGPTCIVCGAANQSYKPPASEGGDNQNSNTVTSPSQPEAPTNNT